MLEIRNTLEELAAEELPGLNEEVSFDLAGASLQEVLRSLAKSHSLNINIGQVADVTVSNSFNGVKAKDLIYFLCDEYQLEVKFVNTIMSFSQLEKPRLSPRAKPIALSFSGGKVTANLSNDSIYSFSKRFAELTNVNISIGPGLEGILLNGYIQDLSVSEALQQVAFSNDLDIKKISDKIFTFSLKEQPAAVQPNAAGNQRQTSNRRPRSNTNRSAAGQGTSASIRRSNATGTFKMNILDVDSKVFRLDADGSEIAQLIVEVSDQLGINYVLLTPPDGYFDGFLKEISYDEFLSLILPTANSSYTTKNGVYLIGEQQDKYNMVSDLYQMQNRSIDSLDVLIPESLLETVTIQPYNGLNAMIVSGDELSVKRMMGFLAKIDQKIPNILIEIIVAEIRKGYSVRTGITAGLADSTISSGGTVFPGLDLTLSSNSVNNFLTKLDSKGIINLGQVTPQFYATVQAMEDNNYLNTRSTPKLSTLNGETANLKIGEKVFYQLQRQDVAPGVTPIITNAQRFEQTEAFLNIKISPFVAGNEDITLTIDAEFSDFIEPSFENGPPGTATRQFQSKIRVRNEEMIVLGGLEEKSKSETGSGVPGLSRIPVLKWLFSGKSKNKAESRLVVFIKPTVIY
ncbi:MAG: type II and III secretion system protein [Bacteroidota bacterium]